MRCKDRDEATVHEPVPARGTWSNRGGDDSEVLRGESRPSSSFHLDTSPSVWVCLRLIACFVMFSQEEDVVFRCEWCEGTRSVLGSSLETLPRWVRSHRSLDHISRDFQLMTTVPLCCCRVFILQLKRFSTDQKNTDPVRLQRDILVRSAQVTRSTAMRDNAHLSVSNNPFPPFQNAACYSLISVINHLGTLNGGNLCTAWPSGELRS